MHLQAPEGYDLLLCTARDDPVTLDDLQQFVAAKPGIDNGQSKTYYEKLLANDTIINKYLKENELEDWMTPLHQFPIWLRMFRRADWHHHVKLDGDHLVIGLNTDMYWLWDAVDQWTKYRQWLSGLSLDNGWYRHAVKLAARYQWWTLTGKENWHRPTKRAKSAHNTRFSLVTSPYFSLQHENAKPSEDVINEVVVAESETCVSDEEDFSVIAPEAFDGAVSAHTSPARSATELEVSVIPPDACAEVAVSGNIETVEFAQSEKHYDDTVATLSRIETDANFVKESRRLAREYAEKLQDQEAQSGCNLHTTAESVFLWDLMPYTNYKKSIPAKKLLDMLDTDFKQMNKREYETHMLRDFYEEARVGYRPVWIHNSSTGSWQRLGTIEHILPTSFFMFNHPRFYMMCHARVNSHMSNKIPEYRLACGLKRYELSKVKREVERFKEMDECKAALEKYYATMEDVVRPQ